MATETPLNSLAQHHRNDWHNMTEMAGTMATELSTIPQNTKKILKLLGRNLKMLRKSKGVSLEELSKAVKISPNKLNKIEQGDYDIWLTQLWRLAEYFGEKPSDLLKKKY